MQKLRGLFSKDELKTVPKKPGVYFILSSKYFSRLKGKTNILYIGKATNLYIRLLKPRKALPRFATLRANGFVLKFRFNITKTRYQAKQLESANLIKFEKDHLELPPLNHSN